MNKTKGPYERFTATGGADRDWMIRRACRDVDPDVFFPSTGGPGPGAAKRARRLAAHALSYCETCPVITECNDYAIRLDIRYGVWGGITEIERDLATDRPKR